MDRSLTNEEVDASPDCETLEGNREDAEPVEGHDEELQKGDG